MVSRWLITVCLSTRPVLLSVTLPVTCFELRGPSSWLILGNYAVSYNHKIILYIKLLKRRNVMLYFITSVSLSIPV
jgi:hypothetical protein